MPSEHVLDPLALPLRGSHLIEASAGTGKTWTIAALYLRLVLGHGGEAAAASAGALAPGEILVLTFTRAATRELSDRIRRRLMEAALAFRGDAPGQDPLIADLMADYPQPTERRRAAWRLAAAADNMDTAAIHTIDAWCQRMLREHAFDSGSLFQEELLPDEQGLVEQATQDYWRQCVYPLHGEVLEQVLAVWPQLGRLQEDMQAFLRLRDELPEPAGDAQAGLAERVQQHAEAHAAALAALKQGWSERSADLKGWLQAHAAAKDCPFDKTKLKIGNAERWLDALAAWADVPDRVDWKLTSTAEHRLTPEGFAQTLKPGVNLDLPEHFERFSQLLRDRQALPELAPLLRLHAAAHIGRRLDWLKQQSGHFGFDDLLQRLDAALLGAGGERLRQRMLAQYPVAMIDEFQDTSALQSRIFDSLYRLSENLQEYAVFLIGDPKQSIYGFRGADIYSYLAARRATAGRQQVLGTNHRSTAALVQAVNSLFERGEQRPGEGAFRFRSATDDALPFVPVKARGRAERFVCSQGAVPALHWCFDGEAVPRTRSLQLFAGRCAQAIVALLNDEQAGFVSESDGRFERLRPADIAVLVRDRREAEVLRRELRSRQVASVFLSNKDSVFESQEALDLLRWLRAVAEPRNGRLMRVALATATVGLSLQELDHLADSDAVFEQRAAQFRHLHESWRTQGVLTMLRQSLHLFALPERWLAEPDGERRLTNYLHLSELLQQAGAALKGEQALLRWLASQIEGRQGQSDERIVRLESDADLLQVVTVHKSKGLEYPLVFLPFACSVKPVQARRTPLLLRVDSEGRRSVQLQVDAHALAEAERERQREDLRLLYVAMTRARHAIWAGVGIVQPGNRKDNLVHLSALGYLLTGPNSTGPEAVHAALAELCEGDASQRLEHAGLPELTRLRERRPAEPLHAAAPYAGRFDRRWAIGSFSSLVRDIPASQARRLGELRREDELLTDERSAPLEAAVSSAMAPWHAFPKGALAGNFLHDQLEWLAAEDFALAESPSLQQQLLRRCERQGQGARAQEVLDWLLLVTTRSLPPLGVPLSGLGRRLPEMEFWLPGERVAAAAVDRLCQQHLLAGQPRPALVQRDLRGMLMGFADLIFEHAGRYWVLDYKSNHLGPRDADYDAATLASAMAAHRYDLQAALYLLALHRLLRQRLGASYRPEQQLGGAVFLFLRGMNGPCGGCCSLQPAPEFLEALDQLLVSGEVAA